MFPHRAREFEVRFLGNNMNICRLYSLYHTSIKSISDFDSMHIMIFTPWVGGLQLTSTPTTAWCERIYCHAPHTKRTSGNWICAAPLASCTSIEGTGWWGLDQSDLPFYPALVWQYTAWLHLSVMYLYIEYHNGKQGESIKLMYKNVVK